MAASPETLKRTPLYDRHVAAGARLVPFAGWEMPVQYTGIREEHVAVRRRAGVLDVLFTYRLHDRFLTVTNASNHESDLAWMRRRAEGFDVTLHDRLRDYA